MLSAQFLTEFKRHTEADWESCEINPHIYGFQAQKGTRWIEGLSEEKMAEYEDVLRAHFPHDLKAFLRVMNGTDLPRLNVYGNCGHPYAEGVGVYSYPRDIEIVKFLIKQVNSEREELRITLAEQGFDLAQEAGLVPFYIHRYVVCTSNLDSSVVLSIASGSDAIVYGDSLQEYLEKEFFGESIGFIRTR
jgi:hypothetical protein